MGGRPVTIGERKGASWAVGPLGFDGRVRGMLTFWVPARPAPQNAAGRPDAAVASGRGTRLNGVPIYGEADLHLFVEGSVGPTPSTCHASLEEHAPPGRAPPGKGLGLGPRT